MQARYLKSATKDTLLARITVGSDVNHGKPSIRACGTRSSLSWNSSAAGGMSTDGVPERYDNLKRKEIYAVLLYAARLT